MLGSDLLAEVLTAADHSRAEGVLPAAAADLVEAEGDVARGPVGPGAVEERSGHGELQVEGGRGRNQATPT